MVRIPYLIMPSKRREEHSEVKPGLRHSADTLNVTKGPLQRQVTMENVPLLKSAEECISFDQSLNTIKMGLTTSARITTIVIHI